MKARDRGLLRMAVPVPLATAAAGCGRADRAADGNVESGIYRAVLRLPGGELPFGLDLERAGSTWTGYLMNGPERLKLDEVAIEGSHLQIRMPGYENRLTADRHGDQLQGEIVVSKPGGKDQHLPFSAEFNQTYRFFPRPSADHADVSGRWKATFTDDDGKEEAAVGEFTQSNDVVTGTFLADGGDHRYLAGQVQGNQLYLSTFDGAHSFLYKAQVAPAGDALTGDFWYGLAAHRHFVAKRDAQATLADAYTVTSMKTTGQEFDFAFPDLDGKTVTSKDAKFRGKVVVVALAGSWCPNCHDEAAFLEPLYKEYRDRGLEVVALMFEHFGDFGRAKEATERFRQQYGVEYSTLIAGISDVDEAGKKLPMLQKFYGFPTTVIVDRKGQVRKIHTGFSGPATGEHYKQFVSELRSNLDQLLAEPANGA
jgi:thiol-disulfide isomerase/thioredoxin